MISLTWKLWVLAAIALALASSLSISKREVSSGEENRLRQHIQLLAKLAADLDNEVMTDLFDKRGGHQGFGKRAPNSSMSGNWLLNYLKNSSY